MDSFEADKEPEPMETQGKNSEIGTNESVNETETSMPPSKKQKSEMWNHFDSKKEDGVRRWAICKYCNKKLTGRSSDGTSHLREHFSKCPRRVSRDVKQQILMHDKKGASGGTFTSKPPFDAATSREKLARMIIFHDYPLAMGEHVLFREFSEDLQPLFKVPSRPTIKNDVMKVYETKKAELMRCLEGNKSRIALTSDMWTASNQKKSYMAVTAHYIDENWSLQNHIISFVHVPSPHTAEALSQAMMESCLDWNIENKLSTLTLDNCSTNDALVDRLLGELLPSSLILRGKLFHMRCCAHIVNLIVQEGFSAIGNAIANVRDSVSFWNGSPKRYQDFKTCARQIGVSCSKELVIDVKTRWNSVFLMLNVALEYKDVFIRLSKKEKTYISLPSEEDWNMAKEVCEKLKIFHTVTEKFSGTRYPTSNIFFPLICDIKVNMMSWQDSPSPVIRNLTKSMLSKFEKYWGIIHGVLSVVVVFDPRYKLRLINYFYPKIYGDKSKDEIFRIKSVCNDLFEEYRSKYVASRGTTEKKGDAPGNSSAGESSGKASWEVDFESMVSEDDIFETTELDDYLAEKLTPNEDGFDVLLWWKCVGSKFPILQRIARDILAIPISTVASESAFSMSGNKVMKQRSRLKAETVGALMCSQSWLRKELEDKKVGDLKTFVEQTTQFDADVD